MTRTLSEWQEYVDDQGVLGEEIREILDDWAKHKESFLYAIKRWQEAEEDWCRQEKDMYERSREIEEAIFEFFCEVTHGDLTYVDTRSSIAWLRWDHKVWCKHSLTELCEKVQHLKEENEKLRGEETPYWKEGEEAPCRCQN